MSSGIHPPPSYKYKIQHALIWELENVNRPERYLPDDYWMRRILATLWPRILEVMVYTLIGIDQIVLVQSSSPVAGW